jgi:aminoglycoside 3-N-acetyltransferase
MLVEFFKHIGLKKGSNLILHSSFKKIRECLNVESPNQFLEKLMNYIGEDGSLMIPTFTYNFKKTDNEETLFTKTDSESLVGAISETFRKMDGVIRTSSATHSFALWGACAEIGAYNNPASPLGLGSPLEWLDQNNGSILLLGTDFTSMSYIHYLEVIHNLPWLNSFCWKEKDVLPISVSSGKVLNLTQVPGCSRGFTNLHNHIVCNHLAPFTGFNKLTYFFSECHKFKDITKEFFIKDFSKLLCDSAECSCCNFRRTLIKQRNSNVRS